MEIEYDPAKNTINIEKHGIDFEDIQMFDFDSATIRIDTRSDYGETRFFAYGYIGHRMHQIAFTLRGTAIRPISLRKANKREVTKYAKT